jgi:D-alanyl-D-alanine carboxypeptidase (penicillin-binding protein 5/6)
VTVACLALVLVVFSSVAPAAAIEPNPPPVRAEAGLLIDLATGQVLYTKNAGEDRAPASLVKLMTLYLAHEDLEAGKVRFDDPVVVSQNAARTPRFRMGLSAGDVIPLRAALLGVAVASANDAATAVAEHLAGTEETFVARMNATAEELGLTQTAFANPHGLPDPRQRTTARDIATLVGRLITTFPESRNLLGETEFTWDGRVFRRQISLFRNPGGVTALKTGYTLEARYNLAVTAVKAGQRLLCIILGAETRTRSFLDAGRLLKFGFGEPAGPTRPIPRRMRVKSGVSRVPPR